MADFYFNFCQKFVYHPRDFRQSTFWSKTDVLMMKRALALAQHGANVGEVPVGAVITHNDSIIGTGYNCPISTNDPTAHAEIVALRSACQQLQNYRLPAGSTLYITLEPCTMCLGALIHARVNRVVFGAYEPKAGAAHSQLKLQQMPFYNHTLMIQGGLLAKDSATLLSTFFKARRAVKQKTTQSLINHDK